MTNREKYNQTFIDCFSVTEDVLNEEFVYQCIPAWDSVGHMGMIASLEDAFDIMMDIDDIVDFSSYTVGIEKLKNYDIVID
jgi:acyl carrier protein